jgi:hypothetical protein
MTTRTTQKDLDGLVSRLNRITNSPATYSTMTASGAFCANIGYYHLDSGYGGSKLVRTNNQGGGVTCPISSMGYETKKVAYHLIAAFIAGIESQQTV